MWWREEIHGTRWGGRRRSCECCTSYYFLCRFTATALNEPCQSWCYFPCTHLIANWALVALVMRHELLRRSHNLRVLRVGLKSIHGNDHALLHTIWYHFADKWTHGLFQGLQSYGVTWATGYEVLSTVAFLCLWTCDRYTTSSRKCEILGKYQLVWPLKLTDITTIPPFSTWPYIKLIYSKKSVEEYK